MAALNVARGAAAPVIALAVVLTAAWIPRAYALNPALDIAQYAHTAWRLNDGFAPSGIGAIAQTSDGYLWLGTDLGIMRFDGVRSVPWQPPDGEPLPDNWIRTLLGTRDGALWIGTLRGLVSFKDGQRTSYPELAALAINDLREDRDGTVWVAAQAVPVGGTICTIRGGEVRCEGQEREFGAWVGSLHEDDEGRLWASSSNGLWRWLPAPAQLFSPPIPVADSFQNLIAGDNGALLMASRAGVTRFADGRFEANVVDGDGETFTAVRLLRDRSGVLWVGTRADGLVHVREGRTDTFRAADGLSGDYIMRIFEDREGTIWVGTIDGLDRFRELAVSTVRAKQGLSSPVVGSVLATEDGSVWITSIAGLNRWREGRVTVYGDPSQPAAPVPASEPLATGAPGNGGSLFQDSRGRVWVGALDGIGYIEGDRFVHAQGITGGIVDAFAEDRFGDLWVAHRSQGLVRLRGDEAIEQFSWADLSRQAGLEREDTAFRLTAEPQGDGLWLGFRFAGVVARLAGGEVRAYSTADGLGRGQVRQLRVAEDGAVWAATEGGLSRIEAGRIATLRSGNGLPCDTVDSVIEDDADSSWFYMACGLVRIARTELAAWVDAAKRDEADRLSIRTTVLSHSDGIRSNANVGSWSPHLAKTPDGRLWLSTESGVSVLDPSNLPRNAVPPPVRIEQIVADRKPYDAPPGSQSVPLPPLVRDLQIDYTALSLIAPEKMQFRYRLEGQDEDWQEAGTRRQAFYTDLSPGDYRFRVIASNNDGVWNEEGASVAFTIAPAFYQTAWFALLCIAIAAGMLWILYVVRVRQVEARMALRLEERVTERERIARDLHDTFLQSVHGLILKFQAVMTRIPESEPSRSMLEQALERADQVLAEGRDRVYELRGEADAPELPQALAAVGADLTPIVPTEFRVTVEGDPQALHPVVREEAYRIGAEALRNAFRHAEARHIDLEIEYSRQGLSLRIVDDGRGFDVTALSEGAPGKHFGLTGLRERARKMRSQLEVSSRLGSGTEVLLRVPAVVAFAVDRRAKGFVR
jgi:signal transduction histidine kinase/ligand-binding sensor domain-containing protein